MAYPDDAGGLIVSLQDRSASRNPTVGHRGFGVLHGVDLAVVSVTPGATWESAFDLEVLIAPTAPDRDNVVERLRCRHLELASLQSAPDSRVALIRLASSSLYATEVSGLPPHDTVVSELTAHAELVNALVQLDLFPAGLERLDPNVVLAPIDVLEELQRAVLQVDRLGRSPGDIANCIFSPKCHGNRPPARF